MRDQFDEVVRSAKDAIVLCARTIDERDNTRRHAAALARDLEGACRRLAELGEPMSKPQSLVDWDKMKEGV